MFLTSPIPRPECLRPFQGGLTVHDFNRGLYSVGPTLIIKRDQDDRRPSK